MQRHGVSAEGGAVRRDAAVGRVVLLDRQHVLFGDEQQPLDVQRVRAPATAAAETTTINP